MRAALLLLAALAACATARPSPLRKDVDYGRARATVFFEQTFPRPFALQVYPDRAAFNAHMREVLHDPTFDSACWMVGIAASDSLALLDPARWKTQACDHDDAGAQQVRDIVAHEIVHVFHCQVNPLLDSEPERFEPMGWFVEGLAVYASGQLNKPPHATATEAFARGELPERLADVWKGKYRYGLSGDLVWYIDRHFGRAALVRMLRAKSQEELLAVLGVSEEQLLHDWKMTHLRDP